MVRARPEGNTNIDFINSSIAKGLKIEEGEVDADEDNVDPMEAGRFLGAIESFGAYVLTILEKAYENYPKKGVKCKPCRILKYVPDRESLNLLHSYDIKYLHKLVKSLEDMNGPIKKTVEYQRLRRAYIEYEDRFNIKGNFLKFFKLQLRKEARLKSTLTNRRR